MELKDHPDYQSFIQFEGFCLDIFIENENSFMFLGNKLEDIRAELRKSDCGYIINFWSSTPWNQKLKVLNSSERCLYFAINDVGELSAKRIAEIIRIISKVTGRNRSEITIGVLISDYLKSVQISLMEHMFRLVGLRVKAVADTFMLLKENSTQELAVKEITL